MIELLEQPSPNAIAEQLTGRSYISHSSITTYATCPLRHYFRYVEGLAEETVSSSLVFGGAIHAAIELHFNELLAGNPAPGHVDLLGEFWEAWRDRSEEATINFGKGEEVKSIADLAERVLRAFCASDLANPSGRILGIEEELRGAVVPGAPDLLARIDLIIETDEALVVTDFKTARSRWSDSLAQDQAEQLLLYSELAKQLAPGKDLRLEFAVLTKAKFPVADRLPVHVDHRRIARTKSVVRRIWQAIQAGHYYPSPSPINCPSCPFREPCRRWSG